MQESLVDEFAQHLQELIAHMNELRYDKRTQIIIAEFELTNPMIYYKDLIELKEGETYGDILMNKEDRDRRSHWRNLSEKEENLRPQPEQNNFKGQIGFSKIQAPYRGEILFYFQSDSVQHFQMTFSGPLKNYTDIDLENKRIRFTIRKGLDKMNECDCNIYFNWRNRLMQTMILEEPEFLVVYNLSFWMKERKFSVELYNVSKCVQPLKTYEQMVATINQLTRDIEFLDEKEKEETDERRKEAIKRVRRKSVTDKIELDGILTLLREKMKKINVDPVRREPNEEIPPEQQGIRNERNEPVTKQMETMTEGKKPGREDRQVDVQEEPNSVPRANPRTNISFTNGNFVNPTANVPFRTNGFNPNILPVRNPINFGNPNVPVNQFRAPNQMTQQPVMQSRTMPVQQPVTYRQQNIRQQPIPVLQRSMVMVYNPDNKGYANVPAMPIVPGRTVNNGYTPGRCLTRPERHGPNSVVTCSEQPIPINPTIEDIRKLYPKIPANMVIVPNGEKPYSGVRFDIGNMRVRYNPVTPRERVDGLVPVDISSTERLKDNTRHLFRRMIQDIKNMRRFGAEKLIYTLEVDNVISLGETKTIEIHLKGKSILVRGRDLYDKGDIKLASMTERIDNIEDTESGLKSPQIILGEYQVGPGENDVEMYLILDVGIGYIQYKILGIEVTE